MRLKSETNNFAFFVGESLGFVELIYRLLCGVKKRSNGFRVINSKSTIEHKNINKFQF